VNIREERFGDVSVLSVAGEFDARTAPLAHAALDGLLEQLQKRLVFNVSGMEIVTSTAISFLIDAAKRTRKLGGDAVLSEAPRLLMSSLRSLDVGEYFRTFESDQDALAHFRELAGQAEAGAEDEQQGDSGTRPPWWKFGR